MGKVCKAFLIIFLIFYGFELYHVFTTPYNPTGVGVLATSAEQFGNQVDASIELFVPGDNIKIVCIVAYFSHDYVLPVNFQYANYGADQVLVTIWGLPPIHTGQAYKFMIFYEIPPSNRTYILNVTVPFTNNG